MEDFQGPAIQIKDFEDRRIAACDIFVILIGQLYGTGPQGSEKSYTELEYDTAVKLKKPCFLFLSDEDHPLTTIRESDAQNASLSAFRQRAAGLIRNSFTTPEDLATNIVQSIHNWQASSASGMKGRDRMGTPPPKYADTSHTVIFIGHGGHSKEWLVLAQYLKEDWELNIEEFNAKPPEGYTTQAHLQTILDRATFAFLVMTGDDKHADGSLHARENVVHEAGLFQGKLGIPNAVLLVEEGCEIPSNFDGLTHIPFPKNDIAAAFHKVHRVLKARSII
jgi:predicted nucleotide-binding protein